MAETPGAALAAETVLMWLPTPIISYDSEHSVVYANDAFRAVSVSDPVGMDIGTVLDGYHPGEGGGFVIPKQTDETFVAAVRTPTRVASGDPSATTVLKLRRASADDETGSTLTQAGARSTAEPTDPAGALSRPFAPGVELTAEDVLEALATPVVAHDAYGVVAFANAAFRDASVADPLGTDIDEVLDGYQPGDDGGYVTPRASDRTYLATVRSSVPIGREESKTVTLLTLRTATPGDSGDSVPIPQTEGTERASGDRAGLFEPIVENSNDAIFVMTTTQDEFVYVNERACELLGYERSELLSLTPRDVHPHDYPTFHEFMETVVEDGSGGRPNSRAITPTGISSRRRYRLPSSNWAVGRCSSPASGTSRRESSSRRNSSGSRERWRRRLRVSRCSTGTGWRRTRTPRSPTRSGSKPSNGLQDAVGPTGSRWPFAPPPRAAMAGTKPSG